MNQTDVECIERWRLSRDADAFTEIVSRHGDMVYAACRRVLRDTGGAEDATQETFLKLAKQTGPVPCPGGWLHTAAVRTSLDLLRGDVRRREREVDYVERNAVEVEHSEDLSALVELVERCIAELPDTLRGAIVMRFLEGRSHKDIGRELGISRTAVQKRIDKGLSDIRDALNKRGVTSSVAMLPAFFGTHFLPEPMPAALKALIGKQVLAVSAVPPVVAAHAAAHAVNLFSAAKAVAILACLSLFGATAYYTIPRQTATKDAPASSRPGNVAAPVVANAAAPPAERGAAPASNSQPDVKEAVPEQAAVPEVPAAAPKPFTLSGLVSDDSAYAVVGAEVWLEEAVATRDGAAVLAGTTGSDGRYSMSGRIPSERNAFRVFVRVEGFPMQYEPIEIAPTVSALERNFVIARSEEAVKGVVLDTAGRPISGAEVSLIRFTTSQSDSDVQDEQASRAGWRGVIDRRLNFAIADRDGKFTIWLREKSTNTFSVTKKGYAEGRFENIDSGTVDAVFTLAQGGAIAGRVTKPDGNPAKGYTVAVVADCPVNAARRFSKPVGELQFTAATDETGAYALEGLSPQLLYDVAVLSVEPERMVKSDLYRPLGLKQYLNAGPADAPTQADFRLIDHPFVRLHGRVTDTASGRPVASVLVTLKAMDPFRMIGGAKTGEDGGYDVQFSLSERTPIHVSGVYSGDYGNHSARLTAKNGEPAELTLSPGDVQELDLAVPGCASVGVLVTDAGGNPIPEQSVGIGSIANEGRDYGHSRAVTDSEGRYLFQGLPPDKRYFVFARRNTAGAQRGDASLLLAESEPFDAQPAGAPAEVRLVITNKGGIEGTLEDERGEPLAGVTLMLSAESSGGAPLQTVRARTDNDGHFTIVNAFEPGRYPEFVVTSPVHAVLPGADIVLNGIVDLGTVQVPGRAKGQ